jgi:hypothetical protein
MASSEHLVHADTHKAETSKTNKTLLATKPPRKQRKKNNSESIDNNNNNNNNESNPSQSQSQSQSQPPLKKQRRTRNNTRTTIPQPQPQPQDEAKPIYLAELIRIQKRKMQGDSGEHKNGVTYIIVGSSGCGKSTMLTKIFFEDVYADKNKFLVTIFTQSAKSDAFKELDSSIILCPYSVDEDYIRWLFQMNYEYEKKYNFITALDDVIDFRHNLLVNQMFLIMRNTNLTSICSLQYPHYIPPAIRISAYFTFCFSSNNLQGIELCVRYYLAGYLPGLNIRAKMDAFREWTEGGEGEAKGHRFYLLDNLNHACYRIDEHYMCYKMEMISFADQASMCDPTLRKEQDEAQSKRSLLELYKDVL